MILGLGEITQFALGIFYHSLVFVLDLSQLSIFLQIICLEFIDLCVVLLTLLLEEFKLLFEGLVSSALDHVDALLLVLVLSLKGSNNLLLHTELMLALSDRLSMSLLKLAQVLSEHVDLFVLFYEFIAHFLLELLLILIDLILSLFPLLSEPGLQLVFLGLIEVLQLCKAFL